MVLNVIDDWHAPVEPWRPIETAPKDGTHILAYERRGGPREMWFKIDMHYSAYWQDEFDSEPTPTHWMPLVLPSPPSVSGGPIGKTDELICVTCGKAKP